jgi:hypothetical protein
VRLPFIQTKLFRTINLKGRHVQIVSAVGIIEDDLPQGSCTPKPV